MRKSIKIMVIGVLCVMALSCGKGGGKTGAVLYQSEDKKIKVYEAEVNTELQKTLEASSLNEKDIPKEELDQMKINIIKNIAMTRAIALEGKAQKLDKNKKYTNAVDNALEGLLASITVAERANTVEVGDDKLKQVYEANKASFERKEDTVRLQLIIVNAADKTKAENALKEAVANPGNFTELVKKYTDVPDNANGETTEIPLSQLSANYGPISEAIKDFSAGQVVKNIINVENESYIVKVLERNAKGFVPFDKVKNQIKPQVIAQEKQLKTQSYMQEISDKYKLNKISAETVKLPKK